jgi:hypothetical protein
VEKRPREARAREPPASTMEAMVPPWSMPRRLVWCFWMGSSNVTCGGLEGRNGSGTVRYLSGDGGGDDHLDVRR